MAAGWGPGRRAAATRPARPHLYGPAFYDQIRAGVQSSAAVVVPIILRHLAPLGPPPRVVDVGCGEGWWAQTFADAGCEVIGVDGAYVTGSPLGDRFLPHDLAEPLPAHLAGRFDLALCLEVAEHLPASRADGLIADLAGLAPVALFSAAIPGQGGAGHINEQWPDYWLGWFAAHGYRVSGALRWAVWDVPAVEPWYRQNLLLAARDDLVSALPGLFRTPLAYPWQVVHPTIYDWRRR
jgi:SAM-dependent methyltransferase